MDRRTCFRDIAAAVMLFSLLAGGCDSSGNDPTTGAPPLTGAGPALVQGHYDATVTSFDGTSIAITVFVPDAPADTPVPLVVHSHGWGAQRMHSLEPRGLVDKVMYSKPETAAKLANENGYYVISFDQRGWGESGGTDQIMDPEYEGRDFRAVLDWAEANLGPQLARRNGKLVVGTLGYSYGGGFQLMAASIDDRVAAIVPSLAWYNFPHGIGPGAPVPQPRTEWIDILVFAAKAFGHSMYPNLLPDLLTAASTGVAPQWIIDVGNTRGANAYCEGHPNVAMNQRIPTVPTLLVQGWQDTLLNANQAIETASCLRDAGADVRLLIQQYGHTLPIQQTIPKGDGVLGVAMQTTVTCGSQSFDLAEAMYSFLDEAIRGNARSGPHVELPRNCLTLDDQTGITPAAVPQAGETFRVPSSTVSDRRFIPLYTATETRDLAGVPHIRATIESLAGADAYVYLGIGIRRAGSSTEELLDDQLLPIQGAGRYDLDMAGVACRLQPGDVLGLLASNHSPQFAYQTAASRRPAGFAIAGRVALPFVAP